MLTGARIASSIGRPESSTPTCTTNVPPEPMAASSPPASAGPTTNERLSARLFSTTAFISRSGATNAGMSAWRLG
jgi:hypothetical protein